jgi:hypothetical protein
LNNTLSAKEFRELIDGNKIVATKKGLVSRSTVEVTGEPTVEVEGTRQFVFYDIPKYSSNQIYAGIHWTKRKAIKDEFKKIIPVLANVKYPVIVSYDFYWARNVLDATNNSFCIKMIEDILFSNNDGWDKIQVGHIRSFKGTENKVIVTIRNT